MTTPDVRDAVELEVRIDARPETVFAFFTEPEKLLRWMGIGAELDPRPGGIFRLDVTGRDISRGEYLEVVPHSRIVFSFGWEGEEQAAPAGSSIVEVTLTPDGEGTRLRLRHHGLPEAALAEHRHGWGHYLGRLSIAAAGGDAGVDPMTSAEGMRN